MTKSRYGLNIYMVTLKPEATFNNQIWLWHIEAPNIICCSHQLFTVGVLHTYGHGLAQPPTIPVTGAEREKPKHKHLLTQLSNSSTWS